ncbi:hypothetical protein [Frankia tisae]|uniref:hypothetical protein n=1 Tax=Frankia tisae TaxID=2950104 RepID=UPI0021BE834F|nr:hypothetical protein [Frankia tisae]
MKGEEVGLRVGRVAGALRELLFDRVDGLAELDGDPVRVGPAVVGWILKLSSS